VIVDRDGVPADEHAIQRDLPAGESCGSCYFGRVSKYGNFCCCFSPPVTNPPRSLATFPGVDPALDWCGQWSQTSPKTAVVLQTTAAVTRNQTAATLGDTTGLLSGKYYAISGPNIMAGTVFSYAGTAAIQLSIPANGSGTVSVTISDSY
jgi:hypothetical protein